MGGDKDRWTEKSEVIRFEPELLEEWRLEEKEFGEVLSQVLTYGV